MSTLNDSVQVIDYWCHNCGLNFELTPKNKCLYCDSSFIEEILIDEPLNDIEENNDVVQQIVDQSVEQCSICLESIDEQWMRLRCGHGFHESCIKPWLERADTCPTCRTVLHISGGNESDSSHDSDDSDDSDSETDNESNIVIPAGHAYRSNPSARPTQTNRYRSSDSSDY